MLFKVFKAATLFRAEKLCLVLQHPLKDYNTKTISMYCVVVVLMKGLDIDDLQFSNDVKEHEKFLNKLN